MGIIHYRLLPTCTNTYMLRSIYVFVIHFLKLYRSMAVRRLWKPAQRGLFDERVVTRHPLGALRAVFVTFLRLVPSLLPPTVRN